VKTSDIRYTSIAMDIAPDPAFAKRHGPRVTAAGGRYGDVRGQAVYRRVTLPASERVLIQEIASTYPTAGKIRIRPEGFSDRRFLLVFESKEALAARIFPLLWDPAENLPVTDFVELEFRRILADNSVFDWPKLLKTWSDQDDATNRHRRLTGLQGEIVALKDAIAAEALRFLDGSNDLEDLKALALQLRTVSREAGIEEPAAFAINEEATNPRR
jgi:hypothetical protein